MELGLYGWNKNINYYQSNTKFKGISAPPSPNYAALNLGDGPFDGLTTGFFVGTGSGTELAINVPASYVGSFFDIQMAGTSKFRLDSTKGLRLAGFINSETQSDAAVYAGLLNNTTKSLIILGGSTSHGMDNNIDTIRVTRSGTPDFAINLNGRVAMGSGATGLANTSLFISSVLAINTDLILQGSSGQTADLQQWQNSAGTVLSSISAYGLLSINAQAFTSLTASYSYT